MIEVPHFDNFLPPIVSIVPLQLLAYHIAVLRGCDDDKPRNLAKNVTVESAVRRHSIGDNFAAWANFSSPLVGPG